MARELYGVKFNKRHLPDGNIAWQGFWLGVLSEDSGFTLTPVKIELKEEKERVIITFDDKTQHIIGYTKDVELFYREKKKKEDADKTKDNTNS